VQKGTTKPEPLHQQRPRKLQTAKARNASIRLTPPCTANEEANERFRVRLGFKVMADILITEIGERDTWAACSPRCQLSRFIQIQIAFKLVFKIAFKLVFV
jgi:hypothetical protein